MITDPADFSELDDLSEGTPEREDFPDFDTALEQVADPDATLEPRTLGALSDPRTEEVEQFLDAWTRMSSNRRRWLVERMVETAEANIQMRFERLLRELLEDPDAAVRKASVEGLWEDESPGLVPRYLEMLTADPDPEVRAVAAEALGRFVYLGELGDIDSDVAHRATSTLVDVSRDESEAVAVRRRAIESAGYADRADVHGLLEEQFDGTVHELRVAALCGMGRSADEQWESPVIAMLSNPDAELRYEAALAAGRLTLRKAVRRLVSLTDENDREIQLAAIWALGEIGGDRAERALERAMEDAPDDAFAEAVEDALAMVALHNQELPWDGLEEDI